MQASEKLFLQIIGRFVGERFKAWIAPITERIEKVEHALLSPPVTFTPGQVQHINNLVSAAVQQALIVGHCASLDDVRAAVEKIPAGPAGRDGKDGVDGADGKSITAADLENILDAKVASAVDQRPVEPHVVSGFIDRAGDLHFTGSDGGVFKVGHVVGADADPADIDAKIKAASEKYPPPKDGKDGFSLDDFDLIQIDERTVELSFAQSSEKKIGRRLSFPVLLYQGVWREGDYLCGDCVTHEGSAWIARANTNTRPGTPDSDWQLAVKRGRDGREGKPGQPGPAGKDGRDGRDLTQMGPDGKKW